MSHAEGWIEAYTFLEEGKEVTGDLLQMVLRNRNGIGESMLHWYCIEGERSVIQKIIDLGFDVDTQNDFGQTPLFEAATIDKWNIVELLLRNGANPNIKNKSEGLSIKEHFEEYGEVEKLQKLESLTSRFSQCR